MSQAERSNRVLTIVVACLATAMLMLDISVINTALSSIAHGLDTGPQRAPVGSGRLHDPARGDRSDRRGDRRPARPPAALPPRPRDLHGQLGALRSRRRDRDAGRRAGDPGARGFDDVRDRAGAHLPGHAGPRGSGEGAGRVRRRDRRLVRARAVHRRHAHRRCSAGGRSSWSTCRSALAVMWITYRSVAEGRDPTPRRIDVPGQITLIGGLFLLVLALLRGNEDGWGSTGIVAALVGAAVLLIAFVVVEGRSREPMLPLRLMRQRRFAGAAGGGVRDRVVVLRGVPLPHPLPADGPRHVADPDRPRLPSRHVPGLRRLRDDGAVRGEVTRRPRSPAWAWRSSPPGWRGC